MKAPNTLIFIDNSRGLASLAVTMFHCFGTLNNQFLDNSLTEQIAVFGENGIFVFFIVSGFIMPYTMTQKSYRIEHFHLFIWKRLVRLNPPYYVSIVFVVGFTLLLSQFSDQPVQYSLPQIMPHFVYLNGFLGESWVNVVYWTLAIEFQFYLLLGIIFPLITNNIWPRNVLLVGLLCLPHWFETPRVWVFGYMQYFVFGMVFCFYYLNQISKKELLFLALVVVVLWWQGWLTSSSLVITAVTLALFFMFNFKNNVLAFLGMISYSLYLIHNYTGLVLVAFIRKRTNNAWLEHTAGILAILIAIGCSYVFYKLIEEPSKRWSARVRY